jgi:hypothetical protein
MNPGGFVGIKASPPDRLFHVEISDAVTAAVTYAQRLTHITSNPAVAGFGVGIEFELEENDGTNRVAAYIIADWQDAGEGASADGRLNFGVMTADAAAATAMSIWNGNVGIADVTPTEGRLVVRNNSSANGVIAYFYRDAAVGPGGVNGVEIFLDNATDWGTALRVRQDGTGFLADFYDGAASVAKIEGYGTIRSTPNTFGPCFYGLLDIGPVTNPVANFYQKATDGGVEVLRLWQMDVDQPFIEFRGTAAAADLTRSIVDEGDQASETREGWLKVYVRDDGNQITDQPYFVPIYSLSA